MDAKEVRARKEYMAAKFGITSLEQLKREAKKLKLNIGVFVTPVEPKPAK